MTKNDDKAHGKAPKPQKGDGDDLLEKVKKAQADDAHASGLQAKVDELTQQVAKLTEIAGRAQAELQNAKIRMEREGGELKKYAAETTLRRLLPTIDNFQRAFKHLPEELKSHEWVKGMTAVEQEFMRVTGEMGLKKFDAAGETANPERHEVLMTGPGEAGKVLEAFEDGYEFGGKVIRPAKVKVGSGDMPSVPPHP
ncbi:MAG TPA: nucleotide exchange factor GrpE [Candidatus Peribacteria bacterium]|nr:nucleotide exchange factor GrpE [Candidatus Peribacteria bacterium]